MVRQVGSTETHGLAVGDVALVPIEEFQDGFGGCRQCFDESWVIFVVVDFGLGGTKESCCAILGMVFAMWDDTHGMRLELSASGG